MRIERSKAWKPRMSGAMPRVMPRASMTSATGASSRRASAALLVLPSRSSPS